MNGMQSFNYVTIEEFFDLIMTEHEDISFMVTNFLIKFLAFLAHLLDVHQYDCFMFHWMNFIICVIRSLFPIKIFLTLRLEQASKQALPNKKLFHLRNKLEHFRTWTERSNRNNLQFVTSSLVNFHNFIWIPFY